MPLDGHSYLVAQGWTGKGTGLRQGAISRPLAIPQKKTLSGLGKDRDDAFPFWDHLFTAAASTIKIKVASDDEDSGKSEPSSAMTIKRTTTGIPSCRRPVSGTAVDSGATTPDNETPHLSLLANAKREAAKRGLYSRFFRGPVLGPHEVETLDGPSLNGSSSVVSETVAVGVNVEVVWTKKRKSGEANENWEERKERKRRRKELKEGDKAGKKRAKEKSRMKQSISAEQVENPEEASARKALRRYEREAKRKARQKSKEDSYGEGEENGQKREGKRKERKAKNETSAVEMVTTTLDDSLTCISHNDEPVDRSSTKKPFDPAILHGDVASLDVRMKRRKRT